MDMKTELYTTLCNRKRRSVQRAKIETREMKPATRRTLNDFVEKCHILNGRSRYVKSLEEYALSVSIGSADNQPFASLAIPDDEDRDALLPTFRLFIGDEPTSLREVSKLFSDDGLSSNWKANVTDVRARIKELLDSAPLNLYEGNELITNRDIVNTFLNGEVFHLKDLAKRERFQSWKSDPRLFSLLQFFFANAIASVIEGLLRIAHLTELELQGKTLPAVPTSPFPESRLRRKQKAAGWRIMLRGPSPESIRYFFLNQTAEKQTRDS